MKTKKCKNCKNGLVDGGANKRISKQQNEINNQYDKLITNIKEKDKNKRKEMERNLNAERDKKWNNLEEERDNIAWKKLGKLVENYIYYITKKKKC